MSDLQLSALVGQVQSISAQIQTESIARVVADEALCKRIGSLEAVITGRIQSANYAPSLSGWKLDPISGEFEINSCTLGSASNAPERQMVSVEIASYSKYDLPKNAANLVQFMDAELQKVPDEYRHAAEFEEFDASYGDDSFSSRLSLSYSRPETEEELADRLEKAKSAGTQVKIGGGVISIIHDGVLRCRFGKLAAFEAEHDADAEPAKPFAVVDGATYLRQALIKAGMFDAKIATNWTVKMQVNASGQYFAAGIGLGIPDIIVKASHMEILPDGFVKITQALGKS